MYILFFFSRRGPGAALSDVSACHMYAKLDRMLRRKNKKRKKKMRLVCISFSVFLVGHVQLETKKIKKKKRRDDWGGW